MSYLEEFQKKIDRDDYPGFLVLWEEYCRGDDIDSHELELLLSRIKESRFAARFGQYAETALALWERAEDEDEAYRILQLISDLQSTNSPELAQIVYGELEKRYSEHKYFNEKIRLIGLRGPGTFSGALRNFELLTHLDEGRFVYHGGGWGTGEVMELSLVREEVVIEFEGVPGSKSLSFENAFANLVPLTDDHFLSRRFGDPDKLEEEARKDPVGVVRDLLRDLGPKTAAEIKEELCDLVIPTEDWTKWWQTARSRIKKDTHIETPPSLRAPFRLRIEEITHVERLKETIKHEQDPDTVLLTIYNFLRDFPEIQRSEEARGFIQGRLREMLDEGQLSQGQRIQAIALLEDLFGKEAEVSLKEALKESEPVSEVIEAIQVAAIKKRALVAVRKTRKDWPEVFLQLLFTVKQSALRDYLLQELQETAAAEVLAQKIEALLHRPLSQPFFFVWYFQKVMNQEKGVLYQDKEGQCQFFEAFLTLLHQLEHKLQYRELVKKMYGLLVAQRYSLVRKILKGSSLEFAREFLLLITKSHTLTQHDVKIMHSLAQVAHPSLAEARDEAEVETVLWTTEEGYQKVRDRMHQIAEVEMLAVAREIEVAREHGDLRENAEYKAAQERRARLQSELKMLADQASTARVITENDICTDMVGVGTVVVLGGSGGQEQRYILLGPWDADPDRGILSFQSRFARAMAGLKVGDTFTYQGNNFEVVSISSYFEHQLTS